MTRIGDIQHFVEGLRHARTPLGLEHLLSDVSTEMGFSVVTMFQHIDLSHIDPSLAHMRRGELVGITTAPVSWSYYYRDHNLLRVDPRVLATRHTTAPFHTDEIGSIIRVTAAHRDVIELQRRANIGQGFTVPIHFPGEPSGSCTFAVSPARSLPVSNFAMAHWIGSLAFQTGRILLARARHLSTIAGPALLTDRQLQCAILVGHGLSEREIAKRLGIASETVKRHLKDARRTCGVVKSAQLVTHALINGQLTIYDLLTSRSFH